MRVCIGHRLVRNTADRHQRYSGDSNDRAAQCSALATRYSRGRNGESSAAITGSKNTVQPSNRLKF
jgi:hypothetical protein